MLDWLMLSYARTAVRFGAQHSSYIKTAAQAGCGVKLRDSPHTWQFKSASTWLLGKVTHVLNKERLSQKKVARTIRAAEVT